MSEPISPEPTAPEPTAPEPTAPEPPTPEPTAPEPPTRRISSLGPVEQQALVDAIGGWRGVLDSSVPSAVFLLAFTLSHQALQLSLIAALVSGVLIAVFRVARHEPLRQVVSGLFGVGIAAAVAAYLGRGEAFFLPGLWVNVVYGGVYLMSVLVRRPVLGFVVGAATGDLFGWWRDEPFRKACSRASWVWVSMFGLRLAVQLPLYANGDVTGLGVARLLQGWPFFAIAGGISYLILRPYLKRNQDSGDIEAPAAS